MKISHANIALLMGTLVAGTAIAQGVSESAPTATKRAPAVPAVRAGASAADLALVQARCSGCHSFEQVTAARKTPDEWAETMDRMVDHGLQISPDETKRISDYLAAHYGPNSGS